MSKIYHDRNLVLSYGARINLICLPRSVGKGWTYKDFCISRYLNYEEEFVYVRRYKSEMKKCKDEFFNDVADNFPNNKFAINGDNIIIDKEKAGKFIPLSIASQYKSVSLAKAKNMIFDEMIPEDMNVRYLPNECNAFANLLVTVFRRRDFRVFILCNKTSSITPYNIYFNLPPFNKNYYDKDRKILIWCEENIDASSSENGDISPIAQTLKGTSYSDYAFKNQVLYSGENIRISHRNKGWSELLFLMNISGEYVGVYFEKGSYNIFIDDNCDKTFPIKYNIDLYNLRECERMFDKATNHAQILKQAIKTGKLYFESPKAKILTQNFLKLL